MLHDLLDIPKHNTYKKGREIIKAMVHAMRDALLRGESIVIYGFGTFTIKEITPSNSGSLIVSYYSTARSPIKESFAPRKKVIFKPSPNFTAMLNMRKGANANERALITEWDIPEESV
jgi:hypothetical protein